MRKVYFALVLSLSAPIAFAHHSFVADYDNSAPGTVVGVVSNYLDINPHPRFWIAVEQADGSVVTWEAQGQRAGVPISNGDRIQVTGYLHRRQANSIYVTAMELADAGIIENPTLNPGEVRSSEAPVENFVSYAEQFADYGNPVYPVDITGDWNQRYRGAISINDLMPQPIPFTESGLAAYQSNQYYGADVGLRCLNTGLARLLSGPSVMKIYAAGPQYFFHYSLGQQAFRIINMNGDEAPEDLPLSDFGYSNGYWDGNVLVIETTHLKPMWLDVTGIASSGAETTVIERYRLIENGLALERHMTFYDPYYSEPLSRIRYSGRAAATPLTDGKGCDPDPFYFDLWNEGTLDQWFDRQFGS